MHHARLQSWAEICRSKRSKSRTTNRVLIIPHTRRQSPGKALTCHQQPFFIDDFHDLSHACLLGHEHRSRDGSLGQQSQTIVTIRPESHLGVTGGTQPIASRDAEPGSAFPYGWGSPFGRCDFVSNTNNLPSWKYRKRAVHAGLAHFATIASSTLTAGSKVADP